MSGNGCENCMEYRRGECLGKGLCEFFKAAPTADRESMQNWPKEFYHRRAMERKHSTKEYVEPESVTKRKQKQKEIILKQIERDKANRKAKRSSNVLVPSSTVAAKVTTSSPSKPKELFFSEYRSTSKPLRDLLLELRDKTIIWVSYETYGDDIYRSRTLLQYNSTVKRIDTDDFFSDTEEALCKSINNALDRIRKPSTIYVITHMSIKKNRLKTKIEEKVRLKGCSLHEIVIDGYKASIQKQINHPIGPNIYVTFI